MVVCDGMQALYSDVGYDSFRRLAVCTIIGAQVKTGLLRLDPGQHQRSAAPGAGRPEIVDELEIQGIYHGTDSQRSRDGNSESFRGLFNGFYRLRLP